MQGTDNIAAPKGKQSLLYNSGNTRDIISVIMIADKGNAAYVIDFAKTIPGDTVPDICRFLFDWLKDTIPYVEDPDGVQYVKMPGAVYEDRFTSLGGTGKGADCKSFSVFASACLKNLGIPHFYRFISQDKDEDLHHVYICVPTTGKDYIVIDAVPTGNVAPVYDVEVDFVKKTDRWADMDLPAVAGKIGATRTYTGTAQQLSDDPFLSFDQYLAQNIDAIQARCKADLQQDIKNNYQGEPLRRSKIVKAFDQLWPQYLQYASCLIYSFWDTTKAPLNVTLFADPATAQSKIDTSNKLYDILHNLGCQDVNLQVVADIGCYYVYGISMRHMLNRCYNMINYGTEWTPAIGLPYWDAQTGNVVNTGDTAQSLQDTIDIASCFPLQGGVAVPAGTPYWCVGGYIMPNGASDSDLAAFTAQYTKQWMIDNFCGKNHNRNFTNANQGVEPGYFNGTCIPKYYLWLNGSLPAIPGPLNTVIRSIPYVNPESTSTLSNESGSAHAPTQNADGSYTGHKPFWSKIKGKQSRVGDLGISAIIAIIIAVISAITAIIKLINDIIQSLHAAPAQSATPCPPKDFKMTFYSTDGCIIGPAAMECPGQGVMMKICPDGSKTCLTAAQLELPQNQPVGPGQLPGQPTTGFFDALSGNSKMFLFGGLGLLLLAFLSGDDKN